MDKLSKDVLFLLAMEMDLPNLLKFCSSSKRINSLVCAKNDIWLAKINRDYSEFKKKFENEIMNKSPKQIYQFLVWSKLKEGLNYNKDISLIKETRLDLYGKKITEIPKEIGNLINLQELFLNYSSINKIPKEIGNLINLKNLSLSHNWISEIPKEIGNLINLNTLDLSYNNITKIPKEIGNLINLQDLYLNDNKINEIPKEIGKLNNLEFFWINNNLIKEMPKEVANLKLKSFKYS